MIDHIGIVCYKEEVEKYINFFKLLGYEKESQRIVKEYGVRCLFLHDSQCGFPSAPNIELVIPLHNKSVISKYLKNNKNRLHHIAYEVDNIDRFKYKLKPIKVEVEPHVYVTFLDPKKYGLLIELVQCD